MSERNQASQTNQPEQRRRRYQPQPPTKAQRPELPEWMKEPEEKRETLVDAIANKPAIKATRRVWWKWQGRKRLSDRHPIAAKSLAWVIAFGACVFLIWLGYALYANADQIGGTP